MALLTTSSLCNGLPSFHSQHVGMLAFMNSTGKFYTWKWAVRLLAVCVEGRGSAPGQMWRWVWGFLGTVVTLTASRFSSGACFCLMFTVPEAFPQGSHPAPAFSCSVPQKGSLSMTLPCPSSRLLCLLPVLGSGCGVGGGRTE